MPDSEKTKSSKSRKVVSALLIVLVLGLLVFGFLNRVMLADLVKGLNYSPSAEMAEIRTSLDLTDEGTRIFNAAHPVLDSRDDFNHDCDSTNPDLAVYGCYYSDKIFVFNIDSTELSGFRESTTAHELLHAVWERLSGAERDHLVPLLESAYSENEAELKETLAAYDESEKIDELYVRLATQVKNLPEELETHYSRIFKNQDKIVDFYESYIAPFEELNKKIETLAGELEVLKATIDEKTSAYEERSENFNAEVASFNSCAATAGCFSSDGAFYARRNSLVAEENNLNSLYAELNELINTYNEKVDLYNSNVLRSNTLQNMINSNSSLENID